MGEERHRGIEVSLSGQLLPLTLVVLGAVVVDERVSGPLVDSGDVGPRPVGTSPSVVAASVVQKLPFATDWSVDAQLRWSSGKYIDTANKVRNDAYPLLNLGVWHDLLIGDLPATFRMVATNVLDVRAWNVMTSGAIEPVNRPTVWATLTIKVAGN